VRDSSDFVTRSSTEMSRRTFLHAAAMGCSSVALPLGWSAARTAARAPRSFGSAKNLIFIFLKGGPSHLDTWDPKPNAPRHIRGDLRAIATNVSGIQLSETLPQIARVMDKVALVRSVHQAPRGFFDHESAVFETLTGNPPTHVGPSGKLDPRELLAPSVTPLPRAAGTPSPTRHQTHVIDRENRGARGRRAMLLSATALGAYDVSGEQPGVVERYGLNEFGEGALIARRLVESGTSLVQLNWPSRSSGAFPSSSWDTHAANAAVLRDRCCPMLDAGLSSLVLDLDTRGLLNETLVLAVGEFGRSPRLGVSTSGNLTMADGRDHWPFCYTAFVAGGGISGGQVLGRSDSTGSEPLDDPVRPKDLIATIYHALGIDRRLDQDCEQTQSGTSRGAPLLSLWR